MMRLAVKRLLTQWSKRKLVLTLAGVGLAGWGVSWSWSRLQAQAPLAPPVIGTPVTAQPAQIQPPVAQSAPLAEGSTRVVATIYDNISLTREQFGEYLIARQSDRFDNFINRCIIDHACKKHNIEVTEAELEVEFQEHVQSLKLTPRDFVEKLLKGRYGKSLYEWKEDVIRPGLLLKKLCRAQVQITREDYDKAYRSNYGEKVECRMIMWPKQEEVKVRQEIWARIRESEEEFNRYATMQVNDLAPVAGKLANPIAWHSTGNEELERVVFQMQPGEVSKMIGSPDGAHFAVLKCDRKLPAQTNVKFEDVREVLHKQILEKKVQLMIPEVMKKLREEAKIMTYLIPNKNSEEEFLRNVTKHIKEMQVPPASPLPGTAPAVLPIGALK